MTLMDDNLPITDIVKAFGTERKSFDVILFICRFIFSKVLSFQAANLYIPNKPDQRTLEMDLLFEKSMRMDNLDTSLTNNDTKQENLKFGEFLWKIKKFSVKRNQAQYRFEREIYSDEFYSHQNGYKMCLSAWPDGFDDNSFVGKISGYIFGKSLYLAVLFHIMHGPFDDTLHWPFEHDVTLALIDQKTGLVHCSRKVEYEDYPNNVNRNKPARDRNGGFGYKLIRFTQLLTNTALYENDKIVIKCTVHN